MHNHSTVYARWRQWALGHAQTVHDSWGGHASTPQTASGWQFRLPKVDEDVSLLQGRRPLKEKKQWPDIGPLVYIGWRAKISVCTLWFKIHCVSKNPGPLLHFQISSTIVGQYQCFGTQNLPGVFSLSVGNWWVLIKLNASLLYFNGDPTHHPKRHPDPSSRFSTIHPPDRRTDRPTEWFRWQTYKNIHLALLY